MKYRNKKIYVLLPILFSTAVVGGYFMGKTSSQVSNSQININELLEGGYNNTSKLGTVLSLIDSKYVEEVNTDTLTEEFIQKILVKLDPHSSYMPAKEAKDSYDALAGSFDGIGVVFNMATDTVIIQDVISGGPSEKVGIVAGDRIITVNDSIIAGRKVNQDSVVRMLKGPGGTTVSLGIERRGANKILDFNVKRDKVVQKSIDAAFMITPEIGYIKLQRFARTSHKEFVDAVNDMRSKGMKQLIFDLTTNSGGYLDQAILITNEFLPKGNMIVYTEGINSPISKTYADGSGRLIDQPIVVLIDEGSASASEIVSGALQDNDIGTIIGRRSFGKGLVQEQIPFRDGSAMNLTIARYHTPTGRCIQRPYSDGIEKYSMDIYERLKHSELVNADSIKVADSLKFTTPKGKIVYGGGGIMPDVFVPLDTTSQGAYFVEVMKNNTLFNFTLRYVDDNRAELKTIDTKESLEEYFAKNSENIFNEFEKFAVSKGVKSKLDTKSKKNSQMFVNAYIARNSGYSDNGFYLMLYPYNDITVKAIDFLQKNISDQ